MKTYTGINIQYPISELILSGEKTIETRTYPIPEKYINEEMLLIETPGKEGRFKARARAIIKFTKSIKYKNKESFYKDINLHQVSKNSIWAWKDKPKWGWRVEVIEAIKNPFEIKKNKGIIFTKNIQIPS